jgi:hypothetical protein
MTLRWKEGNSLRWKEGNGGERRGEEEVGTYCCIEERKE